LRLLKYSRKFVSEGFGLSLLQLFFCIRGLIRRGTPVFKLHFRATTNIRAAIDPPTAERKTRALANQPQLAGKRWNEIFNKSKGFMGIRCLTRSIRNFGCDKF